MRDDELQQLRQRVENLELWRQVHEQRISALEYSGDENRSEEAKERERQKVVALATAFMADFFGDIRTVLLTRAGADLSLDSVAQWFSARKVKQS